MSLSPGNQSIASSRSSKAVLTGRADNILPLVDTSLLPSEIDDAETIRAAHRWYEHLVALWAPGVIEAAHDTGIFYALANGPLTSAQVADKCETDPRATRILLDALYAYELIVRTSDPTGRAIYQFPVSARECLLPGGIYSLAGKIAYDRRLAWEAWRGFATAVRTGSHSYNGSEQLNQISEEDYEHLIYGINFWAPPVVEILADALETWTWTSDRPHTMLDVGCGTGLYGQLLARRFPTLSVTGLDVERITQLAAKQAIALDVGDRFRPLALDFQNDEWGTGFDLIFFGNIFHLQTPETAIQLMHKAAAALSPTGIVAITDHIVDDDNGEQSTQNRFFRLFAASMLATGGGDAYRLEQYDSWLKDVDLKRIDLLDTPMHRILLATRRS